mgnify:CR=1 FL=1
MTITEIQEEIIDEFSMFDDWMERYEYIICLLYTSDAADE